VQQGQEVRDDVLDVVRDEDLVRVQVDLVLPELQLFAQLREVEDAREVERICARYGLQG
jgi:hypothetical protein